MTPRRHAGRLGAWLALAAVACGVAVPVRAADYELRLVPYNDLNVTVAAAIERQTAADNAALKPYLDWVHEQYMSHMSHGVPTIVLPLPQVCWASNITLDGKPVFEIYEKGKYIDRVPVARPTLAAGKHTLWPGDHVFVVQPDGTIKSEDPDLVVETQKLDGDRVRHVVKIKCYPITLRAESADGRTRNATDAFSMDDISLPNLTLRDAAEQEQAAAKTKARQAAVAEGKAPGEPVPQARELLPQIHRFLTLTAWLPANSSGAGYLIHPLKETFQLGAKGVSPGTGGGRHMPAWKVKEWEIVIPVQPIPASGEDRTAILITDIDKLSFELPNGKKTGLVQRQCQLYAREEPYEFRVSEANVGPGLPIDGDLAKLPNKMFFVEWSDPARLYQRGLVVETETRHLVTGQKLRARVRGLDCTLAIQAAAAAVAAAAANVAPAAAAPTAATGAVAAVPTAAGNLLGDATPFARFQARDAKVWEDLPVTPGTEGMLEVAVPAKATGIYKLRLGLHPSGAGQRDLYTDHWVTLAPASANGIGLFTRRGRSAFCRGESFWVAVAVVASARPVPVGTALEVVLVCPDGQRLPLFTEKTSVAIDKRETFIIDIGAGTSQALAPGRYSLEARLGDQAANALRIDMVEPAPETHFTNLLLGKYNTFGNLYADVVNGISEPDEMVRAITGSGYNAFMGMAYSMDRVHWPEGNSLSRLAQERPAIGPWEAYAQPSGRDQFLDAAVRQNLRFYENIFTQHDSMMPRGDKMLDACARYTTLETESMLHSPAFRGVCLYDELSQSLDHDSSMAMISYFHQADELAYRRKTGRTSSDAQRALDRFLGRPEGQRQYQDVADYRTWPMHLDDQWREFSARIGGAVKQVMPDAVDFALARISALPGSYLQWDFGTREGISQPLEAASAVGYKDMGGYGEWAVGGALAADVLRTKDGLLVWPMLCGAGTGPYSASNLRQTFFTLSQKCDGLTFMQFESPPDASWGDNFNGVRDITASLTTRYGDFFLAAEKGYKQVAILYSRELDVTAGTSLGCETIWTACVRAGYPADILTTPQLLADKAMAYHVLFVPGVTQKEAVPPQILAALKRLQTAGTIIAVERNSRLDLEGVQRVDSEFNDMDDRSGGTFPKYLDHDDERWWDLTDGITKTLKVFLAKHVPPAAEHDLLVGPDWLRCRGAEYMVLPNFAFTGFTGNHKTLYVAPATASLRFPKRPPVCYDMLEMKRLEPVQDGANMTLAVDMRRSSGKIIAFLPAEIQALVVRAPRSVQAGQALSYSVHAADAAGQAIDAGIPLEITISAGAAGPELLRAYRAAAPEYRDAYAVPVLPRMTSITLHVRELISGRVASAVVSVTPGEVPPVVRDTRPVRVFNGTDIRRFLDKDTATAQPLFVAADILNAGALALRLHNGSDALTQYLRSRLAPATQKLLDDYSKKPQDTPELAAALVAELNRLVTGERLYTDERFPIGSLSIAAGALGQTTTDKEALPDINRLLLEEWYAQEIIRRAPVHIAVEEEWMRPDANRLAAALRGRGQRVRVTSLRYCVSAGGVPSSDDDIAKGAVIDGTRLWRGEIVEPGMFLDAPVILLGARTEMLKALANRDLLPEPVSDNFPGPGKAVVCRVPRAFSNYYDTLVVLANDATALSRGVDALLKPDAAAESPQQARPTVAAAAFDEHAQLTDTAGRAPEPASFAAATTSFADRIDTLDIDPATGRILVGTFGFGHNLFCFSKDGALLWKQFLPEHDVYVARWCDDGKRIVAATGQGFKLFLLGGDDGKVLRKFAASEWPDFHVDERETNTKVGITLNPKLRQILIFGRTGLLAVDYDGNRMWFYDRAWDYVDYPPKAVQTAFAVFGGYLRLLSAVPSPDGERVAYNEVRYFASTEIMHQIVPLWRNEPQILDARTGKVLLRNESDPGANEDWTLAWPEGSANPVIQTSTLSAPLLFAGKADPPGAPDPGRLGNFGPPAKPTLKAGGWLARESTTTARLTPAGSVVWQTFDGVFWITALDRVSADETRLYRCSREGLVRCVDIEKGGTVWESHLPAAAHLTPVGTELVAASADGLLLRFDAGGKILWKTSLRDHHELPDGPYASYVVAANQRDRDDSALYYPVSRDAPDDYKDILRLGIEQVDNGDFETDGGWVTGTGSVEFDSQAHSGKRALRLGQGQLVTETVQRRIVPSATYLLEFFYRTDQPGAKLIAGARLGAEKDNFTVSTFTAPVNEWRFGRLAIKTMADTVRLEVGFEAGGGTVRVDSVTLRPIRFPSANLLANAELHKIEPTHPADFRVRYNRVPSSLSQQLLTQNNVTGFLQAVPLGALIFTEEQAFLQNGRLDDVTSMWSYRPDPMGFAVVLTRPAYVSHLVLYLNNSTPDTVYRDIAIVANDMEKKIPHTVALVRGNERRFIVVSFPETLYTDNLKVLPGKYRTQTDSITEIEVYGPVGGPETLRQKRFDPDPLAVPMFMGSPAHVPAALPADLVGKYVPFDNPGFDGTPALNAGITVVDGAMSFALATGGFVNVPVTDAEKQARDAAAKGAPRKPRRGHAVNWGTGSVTPLTTPARYAGRLIAGSADYMLHAVADNGAPIWTFKTGGRVYSSPTPSGDEVYFGSDDGRLYRIDVDSGILIWEFKTGDRVRSAPALDGKLAYAASWDGFLYAVDMERGTQVWKAPIALYTCSSPAVADGRVYIGDEEGRLHCFEAATGRALWQCPVGDRIAVCPLVTPDGIVAIADDGNAALVRPDGTPVWKRGLINPTDGKTVRTRLTGQPFATQSQIVLTTTAGLMVLKRQDGTPDTRFVPPGSGGNLVAAVAYGDRLCLVESGIRLEGEWTRFVVAHGGRAVIWKAEAKNDAK